MGRITIQLALFNGKDKDGYCIIVVDRIRLVTLTFTSARTDTWGNKAQGPCRQIQLVPSSSKVE